MPGAAAAALMLALAILLLGAASVRWPGFGPATIEAGALIAPIAAWLVLRFGRPAWIAIVAVTVVGVLLQLAIDRDTLVIGGRADAAALALGAAWMVRHGIGLDRIAALPAPSRWWAMTLLLLPLFFVVPIYATDDVKIALPWYALGLLLPLCLLAGLRGLPWPELALAGVGAVALGVLLAVQSRGRFQLGDWVLGYGVAQPYLWLPAALAWSAGEAIRRATLGLAPHRPWRTPMVGALLGLVLWLDPGQFGLPLAWPADWGALRWIYVTGAAGALPLAGFIAGVFAGLRGAALVAGLALCPAAIAVVLLWTGDGAVRAAIGNVMAAPIALAWGWLGASLVGRAVVVPTFRVTAATLVVAGLALVLSDGLSATLQLGLSIAAALAAAIGGMLLARFGRRLGLSGEGWIPVLLLPLYGIALAMVGPDLAAELRREISDLLARLGAIAADEFLFRLLLLLPAVLGGALLLREILRAVAALPKAARDVAAVARAAMRSR
ncbi:MAG: hypothetical protein JNK67_06045 [Alphaproteobacteria bacterium]|nr:hypothetical protein [Alphaproteobacteria bacterium]